MKKTLSRNPAGRPRSADVDRAILDAALRLARTHGYAGVTIDGIAAESGVGKPSIYRRWPSKAQIVTEALGRQAEHDVPVPETGSFRRDLPAALNNVARQLRDTDGRLVASLFAEAQLNAQYRPIFQAFIDRRRRKIRGLIESAIDRGELDPATDVDLVLDAIYGPLLYRMLVGHGPIDESFVRAHLQQLFTALGL